MIRTRLAALALLPLLGLAAPALSAPKTTADVIAQSPASDWRPLDPERTLYMDLPAGRVVIELDPAFAPQHFANIKTLVREHYFDGLWIERAQDNYVVQWGDADTKPFTALPDRDTYAPQTGFTRGFPVARDPKIGKAWLAHCYAMVGVGRDNAPDSGPGTELYAVIGNAPRHLDRNVALVGRVVQGMELLSVMPRGTATMGFYDKAEQRTTIRQIRFASDLPADQRLKIEVLRTESKSFAEWVQARRFPASDWFVAKAGHVELCNVNPPSRVVK